MNDKPATTPTIERITLKQLCAELKIHPREARERLRLAVRDTKKKSRACEVAQTRPCLGVAQEFGCA